MMRSLGLIVLLAAVISAAWADDPSPKKEKSVPDQLIDRVKAAGLQDKSFGLVVVLKVKKDKIEAMSAAATKALTPSRAEKGCAGYTFQQNAEAATEFIIQEKWRDLKGLQDHFGTPHFKELFATLGEVLDEPPQIRIVREVDDK